MNDVFILSATRSPIGRFGGAFRSLSPAEIAAPILRSALDQSVVPDLSPDLVLLGHVLRGGHGQLVPRQAAKLAGIPDSIDAVGIDMVCSSGMMSLIAGAAFIQSGASNLILAGGVESMSDTRFALSSKARWGYKYLPGQGEAVVDLLYRDGLSDPTSGEAMGVQAERLAQALCISRRELDAVAAESHSRAHWATLNGGFHAEITPTPTRKGNLEQDEGIRSGITVETLADLRSVFVQDGLLTAGNSSQISDGAAALLLASGKFVRDYSLRPIARIHGSVWAAGTWDRFVEVPAEAARRVLGETGMLVEDIDLYENNEAFALSTVLFVRDLGIDPGILNVNGGAIALGHPIGCSGARVVVTLLHALRAHGKSLGLAALCHGTGGGTAVVVECL